MPTWENSKTVQERILLDYVSTLKTVLKSNGYELDVKHVERRHAPADKANAYPSIFVIGGPETKSQPVAHGVDAGLPVILQIYFEAENGDDPYPDIDKLIKNIEAAICADPTRGGLATATEAVENERHVFAENAPRYELFMSFISWYRHAYGDPTKPMAGGVA